jgi:hypothetical protein
MPDLRSYPTIEAESISPLYRIVIFDPNSSGETSVTYTPRLSEFIGKLGEYFSSNSADGYTDDQARDAVGLRLNDSASIDFTYDTVAKTFTAGVKFGATANTACVGNDSRLTDQRVPLDGSVTTAKLSGQFPQSIITNLISDLASKQPNLTFSPPFVNTLNTITITVATQSNSGLMSNTDKTKLDGIATGATANAANSELRDRGTHTGFQGIETITNLQTTLDGKQSLNSNLTALAALANQTTFGRNLLTLVDQAALLTATGAQAVTTFLTSLVGLSGNGLIEKSGTSASTISIITAIRNFLIAVDTAAARTAINAQQLLSTVTSAVTFNDQPLDRYSFQGQDVSATNLELSASHNGRILFFTASTTITITAPATPLADGFSCLLRPVSTGQISFTGGGTTFFNRSGQYKSAGSNAPISVTKWTVSGSARYFVDGDTVA